MCVNYLNCSKLALMRKGKTHNIFIYLLLMLISLTACRHKPTKHELYNRRWVYGDGYYIGSDVINFQLKDSDYMIEVESGVEIIGKYSNYRNRIMPTYIIKKIGSENLYIESIDGKIKGEYEEF